MNKAYNPIDWKNEPNTSTPINETNLNKMDRAIDEIDNRVIGLDEKKANIENQTFLGTTKFRSSPVKPYGINIEEKSVNYSTPTESSKFNSLGIYTQGLKTGEKAQYTKDGISMSKYGKTTTVEAGGIVSGGDVTTGNGASLDGLKNDLGGVRFGIDENGNYGYIKAGADAVTPFSSGKSGGMLYGFVDISFKVKPYTLIEEDTTESGDSSGGIGGIIMGPVS